MDWRRRRQRLLGAGGEKPEPRSVEPAGEVVADLTTPLPAAVVLGRGQVVFLTGWLRDTEAAPTSAELVASGIAFRSPLTLMGRAERTRPPTFSESDAGDNAVAFYGWLEVPAGFPEPELAVQILVTRRDGSVHECGLGTIRVVRNDSPSAAAPVGDEPLIAICMATYNPPPKLFATQIASIRLQTYANWVCLISDDGSSPESLAQIREVLGSDPRFLLHGHGGRLGFYGNFERALRLAPPDARFVALADQDDCWYPEKLATLLAEFTNDTTTLVYSDMRVVDAKGNRLADSFWGVRRNSWTNLASLMLANTVTGAASMFRHELLDRVLPFPPRLGNGMFHDHWIAAVALSCGRLRFVPRPLYDYVQHGTNVIGHCDPPAAPRTYFGWLRGRLNTARRSFDVHFLKEKIQLRLTNQHAAFYGDALRTAVMGRVLLLRCGVRLRGRDRWVLRRLAHIESSLTMFWLALRGLPRYRSSSETIGFEWSLFLPALAWGRLVRAGIDPEAVLERLKRVRRTVLRVWKGPLGWWNGLRRSS